MINKRELNYDVLRWVSAIAVIMIHVSSVWLNTTTEYVANGALAIEQVQSPLMICVYNSISRFAVPCFLLLSGAFILDNDKNGEYKYFYTKSFKKIGVPIIVFTILYTLYMGCLHIVCGNPFKEASLSLIKNLVTGMPFYHMWYMYMLIGVYALAPIVILFKKSISDKAFFIVSFVLLIWGTLSRWSTPDMQFAWSIGQSFEYLGYFLCGYSIRKMCQGKKNNLKGTLLIVAGFLVEIGASFIEYKMQLAVGLSESKLTFRIVAPYCPLIVLASILIFWGFSLLEIKGSKSVRDYTFFIYLFHGGVLDIIDRVFTKKHGQSIALALDAKLWIPFVVIIVFVVSYVLSIAYVKIWEIISINKKV